MKMKIFLTNDEYENFENEALGILELMEASESTGDNYNIIEGVLDALEEAGIFILTP